MNYITALLSNTGYIMYNKSVAKNCGVNEAIILGEICAKYQYWLDSGKLFESDGWFYLTRDDIENDTGLSSHQQRAAMQFWLDNAVLESRLMGMPATTHYYLNAEILSSLLLNNCTTSCEETAHHVVQKLNTTKKETKKDSSTATAAAKNISQNESLIKCSQHYQENIGTVKSTVKDGILQCLTRGAEPGLICAAIDEAVKQNKRSWSYAEAILERCLKCGVKSAAAFMSEVKPTKKSRFAWGFSPQRKSSGTTVFEKAIRKSCTEVNIISENLEATP